MTRRSGSRRVAPAAFSLALALALAAGEGAARPAAAQAWSLSAAAGRIVHEGLGDRIGTLGTTIGLAYDGPAWLYLTGGVPFDSAGILWTALGGGGRAAVTKGDAALGVDLAGHLYGFRERGSAAGGSGATLEAMPVAAVAASGARLEVRSGVRYYASSLEGETASRRIHQSDVRLSWAGEEFRVTAEGRHVRAEEADYPYLGAEGTVAVGTGTIWALAGRWLSDEIATAVWGVGGTLPVARATELFVTVQQETSDPLYWHVPRRSWSIGVSRRLGGTPTAAPTPVPVAEVRGGEVVFRLAVGEVEGVPRIGGDFTGWSPIDMRREGDLWVVALPVPSGVHRYAYQGEDGEWFVPPSVPGRVEDGFGGYSATVIVP